MCNCKNIWSRKCFFFLYFYLLKLFARVIITIILSSKQTKKSNLSKHITIVFIKLRSQSYLQHIFLLARVNMQTVRKFSKTPSISKIGCLLGVFSLSLKILDQQLDWRPVNKKKKNGRNSRFAFVSTFERHIWVEEQARGEIHNR